MTEFIEGVTKARVIRGNYFPTGAIVTLKKDDGTSCKRWTDGKESWCLNDWTSLSPSLEPYEEPEVEASKTDNKWTAYVEQTDNGFILYIGDNTYVAYTIEEVTQMIRNIYKGTN